MGNWFQTMPHQMIKRARNRYLFYFTMAVVALCCAVKWNGAAR
jgi:hypothetical protein